MPRVRFNMPAWVLGGLLFSTVISAGGTPAVVIKEGWVRAVPASVTDSAAFMRIENTGSSPVVLTGGSASIAKDGMLMKTTEKMVNGAKVLGMAPLDSIEIPAQGSVELKPGGDHLMLMSLSGHPHPGDMVTVTLQFGSINDSVTVQLPAKIDAEN